MERTSIDKEQTMFGKEEVTRYDSPLVRQLRCFYLPQIGFLVAIPRLPDMLTEQQEAVGTDLVYQVRTSNCFEWGSSDAVQFHTDMMVYYKNDRVTEIDEHVGDLYRSVILQLVALYSLTRAQRYFGRRGRNRQGARDLHPQASRGIFGLLRVCGAARLVSFLPLSGCGCSSLT